MVETNCKVLLATSTLDLLHLIVSYTFHPHVLLSPLQATTGLIPMLAIPVMPFKSTAAGLAVPV